MLYVNGDSWSWSYDPTEPTVWPNNKPSIKMWPNMLMTRINMDLYNESMGCGSNSRILDCLENIYLEGMKPELIILALTSHARWHLPAGNRGHWCINPFGGLNDISGQKDEILHKWFYAQGFDKLDSVYRYYKILWNLSGVCQKIGSPYVIFNAWDEEIYDLNLLENDRKIEDFVLQYYDNPNDVVAKKYIDSFKNLSIMKQSWNYIEKPFSKLLESTHYNDTQHPNVEGNEIITDYVFNYIRDNIRL